MSRYACSDLHGYKQLYDKINEYLNPEDIVYCLGDCCDRGPDSWSLIKAVYNNPQWIYLKGNHEDMLYNAISAFIYNKEKSDISLYFYNGGQNTFLSYLEEPNKDRIIWYNRLKQLPTHIELINNKDNNILLSHAGYTPSSTLPNDYELTWSRKHFNDPWIGDENTYVIHGHTPISTLRERYLYLRPKNNISSEWYCNNHKIDIDCKTVKTHSTILFNLDTFEEQIFSL